MQCYSWSVPELKGFPAADGGLSANTYLMRFFAPRCFPAICGRRTDTKIVTGPPDNHQRASRDLPKDDRANRAPWIATAAGLSNRADIGEDRGCSTSPTDIETACLRSALRICSQRTS